MKSKEAARDPGKETNPKKNERQIMNNLVFSTIRYSNEFLKSSDVISMVLQILDNKIYIHYQDTYLGILVTYVLSKTSNHSKISAEQWKELLIICMKLYKRQHLKKHIVLDALQMIVEHSFLHTNLLPYVKNLLPFLGIRTPSSNIYLCIFYYRRPIYIE